jgi:hypothetical protein
MYGYRLAGRLSYSHESVGNWRIKRIAYPDHRSAADIFSL